jgi:hypothetical protein
MMMASWSQPFRYDPSDELPAGLTESGVGQDALEEIAAQAASVKRSLDCVADRSLDCWYAVSEWQRALTDRVEFEIAGGVGMDEPWYDPQHRFVPCDRRNGFREGDGLIHRHWWLALGPGRLIFDPTASKFVAQGWTEPDRYVMDGEPYAQWRSRQQSTASTARDDMETL